MARARPDQGFSDRVVDENVLSKDDIERFDEEAIAAVDEAVKFADESPFPDLDSLYDDIYVFDSDVPAWWTVDERSLEVHRGEHERKAGECPTGSPSRAPRTPASSGARASETRKRARARRRSRRGRRARRRGRARRRRRRGARRRRLMPVMRYREALNQALREEMQEDEKVFLMGEDVGVFQGAFKVTAGLLEEFGEKRVRDTPISENTIVGMGVGAAMIGRGRSSS